MYSPKIPMRKPREIRTVAELRKFVNDDECVRGYLWSNPLPLDASFSFIHGWLNAMVDCGKFKSSEAQRELAHDFVMGSRATKSQRTVIESDQKPTPDPRTESVGGGAAQESEG